MSKLRLNSSLLLIGLIVVSLVSGISVRLSTAQTGTNVTGTICSDTTWTPANSPYTFTGIVDVPQGVALTIEAGVTINIGLYCLQVDGTLRAQGNSTDLINFVSSSSSTPSMVNGQIVFTSNSTAWNKKTNSGSTIENAVLDTTTLTINNASPNIDSNLINGPFLLNGIIISGTSSSPIISNNIINYTGVGINSNPTVYGIYVFSNNLSGQNNNGTLIINNTLSNWLGGIYIGACSPTVKGNFIVNNNGGATNGGEGIKIDWAASTPLIQDNMIAINSVGIGLVDGPYPVIEDNNIQNNTDNSIYVINSNTNYNSNTVGNPQHNVNATYDWWGTSDSQAINQTIHDFKNDQTLGTVVFTPFLTATSTEAPTYIIASADAGGSIAESGIVRVNYGGSQTFTITPNTGYRIADVSVNETSVGAFGSYTVQNVTGATTVFASFVSSPTPAPTSAPNLTPIPSSTPSPVSPQTPMSSSSTSQKTTSPSSVVGRPSPSAAVTQVPTGTFKVPMTYVYATIAGLVLVTSAAAAAVLLKRHRK